MCREQEFAQKNPIIDYPSPRPDTVSHFAKCLEWTLKGSIDGRSSLLILCISFDTLNNMECIHGLISHIQCCFTEPGAFDFQLRFCSAIMMVCRTIVFRYRGGLVAISCPAPVRGATANLLYEIARSSLRPVFGCPTYMSAQSQWPPHPTWEGGPASLNGTKTNQANVIKLLELQYTRRSTK